MKKLNLVACSLVALFSGGGISLGAAPPKPPATCEKPVGTFVAAATGQTLQPPPTVYDTDATMITLIFNSDGSGSYNYIAKTSSASASAFYKYPFSTDWRAEDNQFDTTLCRGIVHIRFNGSDNAYTVYDDGKGLDFMDYSNAASISTVIFHAHKAK